MGGFLAMRLVDHFADGRIVETSRSAREYQVKATSEFVAQLFPRTVEVNHLSEIVRVAAGAARTGTVRVMWPPLLAFAYWLEQEVRYDEALDVLTTALRLQDGGKGEEEVAASLQRARVLRRAGRFDEACEGYAAAGDLAVQLADRRSELLSRIGRAIVLQKTGNLPESERLLRRVLEDARALGDRDAEARACHDLAIAMALRERLPEAVPLAFRAFELYDRPTDRARALHDTGAFLKELGHYSAASDAFLEVLAGAPPTEMLLLVELELLEVSALIGDRLSFERWRRELQGDHDLMAPEVRVDFGIKLAMGLASFEREPEAERALRRAIGLAERHGLDEHVFRAERHLLELQERRAARREAVNPPTPAPEVHRTIEAVQALRAEREAAATTP